MKELFFINIPDRYRSGILRFTEEDVMMLGTEAFLHMESHYKNG